MGEVFAVKGIKTKKLNIDAIRKEILNELRAEGTVHRRELSKTTASWRAVKPRFESLIGLERAGSGSASVLTGPAGDDEGVNKWTWLDEGTSIRWAVMSRDWRSKTRRGWFGSGRGQGRVVIAGRRAMTGRGIGPRPGIQARGWSEALTKRRRRPFTRRMIAAMQRGAGKVF